MEEPSTDNGHGEVDSGQAATPLDQPTKLFDGEGKLEMLLKKVLDTTTTPQNTKMEKQEQSGEMDEDQERDSREPSVEKDYNNGEQSVDDGDSNAEKSEDEEEEGGDSEDDDDEDDDEEDGEDNEGDTGDEKGLSVHISADDRALFVDEKDENDLSLAASGEDNSFHSEGSVGEGKYETHEEEHEEEETVYERKSDLHCALCGELCRDGRLLSCLHTFCLECLQKKVKDIHRIIFCPICRYRTIKPSAGVQTLPKNVVVSSLIESQSLMQDKRVCVVCQLVGEERAGVSRCIDCGDLLCEDCSPKHTYSRQTAKHTVVTIDDDDMEARQGAYVRSSGPVSCPSHKEEEVKFYCSKCQTGACRDCVLLSHSSHTCIGIDEALEKVTADIRKTVATLHEHSEQLSDDTYEKDLSLIEQKEMRSAKYLDDAKAELIKVIEKEYDKCMEQLEKIYKKRRDYCERRKAYIDKCKQGTQSLEENIDFILKWGSSLDVLLMEKSVVDAVERNEGNIRSVFPSVQKMGKFPRVQIHRDRTHMITSLPWCTVEVPQQNKPQQNRPRNRPATSQNLPQRKAQAEIKPMSAKSSKENQPNPKENQNSQMKNTKENQASQEKNTKEKKPMPAKNAKENKPIKGKHTKENQTPHSNNAKDNQSRPKAFTHRNAPLEVNVSNNCVRTVSHGNTGRGRQNPGQMMSQQPGSGPRTIGRGTMLQNYSADSSSILGKFPGSYQAPPKPLQAFGSRQQQQQQFSAMGSDSRQSRQPEQFQQSGGFRQPGQFQQADDFSGRSNNQGWNTEPASKFSASVEKMVASMGCELIRLKLRTSVKISVLLEEFEPEVAGMTFTSNQAFAVTDVRNKRVKLFDTSGQFITVLEDQDPGTIAVCQNHLIWNSSFSDIVIHSLDTMRKLDCRVFNLVSSHPVTAFKGEKLLVANVQGSTVEAYRCDDMGYSWVHSLQPVDSQGRPLRKVSQIATRNRDQLALVDQALRKVIVTNFDGRFVGEYSTPGWEPGGLCIDHRDNIFVTDRARNKLIALTPSGEFLQEWKTMVDLPSAVACNGNGMLIVAGRGNAVSVYNYQ